MESRTAMDLLDSGRRGRYVGRLSPDGVPARLVLALLESAGILYASLSPVIVTGLAQSAGFTADAAGYVFSSNMYGTAIGGFLVIFVAHRLNWRRTAAVLLVSLIALDAGSMLAGNQPVLYALRFGHGLVGGALIGVVLAVIARTVHPERTFAFLIMIQLVVGGVLTVILTPQLASLGASIVWLALLGFSLLALLLLPLLGPYPVLTRPEKVTGVADRASWSYIVPAMLAIFVFQSGEMAAWAYVIELGHSYGFETGFTSTVVAISLWFGGPAALIVAWWSTRSGRLIPTSIGVLLTAAAIVTLLVPEQTAYLAANIVFGIFFSIAFPYLMGVATELDNTGQMAAIAGFIGNLGLATGPAIAAYLVGGGQYSSVVVFGFGAVVLSWFLIIRPARMLDRLNRYGRVYW